jgi:hypothetical protein
MDWNAKLQTVLSLIFFFLLSDQNWGKVLHLLILPSVDIIVALKFTFYQMHLGLLFTYLILKFSVMIGLIFILV